MSEDGSASSTTELTEPSQQETVQDRRLRWLLIAGAWLLVGGAILGGGWYLLFSRGYYEAQAEEYLEDYQARLAQTFTALCLPETTQGAGGSVTHWCSLYVKTKSGQIAEVESVSLGPQGLVITGELPGAASAPIPLTELNTPEEYKADLSLIAAPIHSNFGVMAQLRTAQVAQAALAAAQPAVTN